MNPGDDERRPVAGSGGHVEAGQADNAIVARTRKDSPLGAQVLAVTDLGLAPYLYRDGVAQWVSQVLKRLVDASADMPPYGSPEWSAASDPVRLASALRAAEAWRREGLTVAQRAADDLAATDYQAQLDDTAEWARLGAWVRNMANAPDFEELQRRRTVVERPVTGERCLKTWQVAA